MKKDVKDVKKKKIILKRVLKDGQVETKIVGQNESNPKVLTLKSVELYEPLTYEQILNLNKKKYRNLKIKTLKTYLKETLWNLEKAIDSYKELINRTEFWERKSTYEFNFEDWNTLKKVNGKITKYYNDIKKIDKKIESEEKWKSTFNQNYQIGRKSKRQKNRKRGKMKINISTIIKIIELVKKVIELVQETFFEDEDEDKEEW